MPRCGHAPDRHGHRAVPAVLVAARRARAAPGAQALPALQAEGADAKSWRAVGCTACGDTGYLGRTGIYELLLINDELRLLIHNGANDTDVRRTGERSGMLPLRGDAMRWVASGTTSLEEVVRVTRE